MSSNLNGIGAHAVARQHSYVEAQHFSANQVDAQTIQFCSDSSK